MAGKVNAIMLKNDKNYLEHPQVLIIVFIVWKTYLQVVYSHVTISELMLLPLTEIPSFIFTPPSLNGLSSFTYI